VLRLFTYNNGAYAMGTGNNRRKLRNLLVNLSAQRRIIVINLIFMMLVLILTMVIIYTHLVESETGVSGVWNFAIGELTLSFSARLFILYSLLFFVFLFSIVAQLWMTHRVCGALVNFSNTFKKVSGGDFLKRVNLRKDDLLKQEAEQFNDMVANINEMVVELKIENEKLNSALEKTSEHNFTLKK